MSGQRVGASTHRDRAWKEIVRRSIKGRSSSVRTSGGDGKDLACSTVESVVGKGGHRSSVAAPVDVTPCPITS